MLIILFLGFLLYQNGLYLLSVYHRLVAKQFRVGITKAQSAQGLA